MASLWFLIIARFAASGNRPFFKIKGISNSMPSAFSLLYSLPYISFGEVSFT